MAQYKTSRHAHAGNRDYTQWVTHKGHRSRRELLREKPFCVGGKKRDGGGMIKIQFAYMKLFKV